MSVLGYTLEEAAALLQAQGFRVEAEEVRSKKGLQGDARRVVRERYGQRGEERVARLVWAEFHTQAAEEA